MTTVGAAGWRCGFLHPHGPARIVCGWADLYRQQSHGGRDRRRLDRGGGRVPEPDKLAAEPAGNEPPRWLKFFREGERADDEALLPTWINAADFR